MKKLTFFVALFSLIYVAQSSAQAFGVMMGQKRHDLSVLHDIDREYVQIRPPLGLPDFQEYFVRLTPKNGVCAVTATSIDFPNDSSGLIVRRKFNALEKALSEQYGKSGKDDRLQIGAGAYGANEWALSLKNYDRSFFSVWREEEGSKLINDIKMIMLTVRAKSNSTTYMHLSYEFSNSDACDKELSQQKNKPL